MNQTTEQAGKRLGRLLALLESDPDNLALLEDAVETAMAEGEPETAVWLLAGRGLPLPPRLVNLAGLAAMQARDFPAAASRFEGLVDAGESDPGLLFNLAWCRAMAKDFDGALALLTDPVAGQVPQAAMLRIQILHERGELEEAARHAHGAIETHPDYAPLLAAVSVLAIDMEDEALAARCAAGAGDHPDALATLGTLALGEDDAEGAIDRFEQALARSDQVARAWIGRGLAEMALGRFDRAPEDIDRGADMFGDHLGSWLAAGWAYFMRHDLATSRARFDHALELDPNFAETHGSLAVLDLLEGDIEGAKRRTEIAQRLDRASFAAALASGLIANAAGDSDKARRIFELALRTPVDASGRTIAQSLARRGIGLS